MSSTEIVDNVRERIVRLAREIEQLANSSLPPDEFFQQFLDLLVSALGARGGAVWLRNADHRIHQVADVAYADMGIHANPEATQLNEKLFNAAKKGDVTGGSTSWWRRTRTWIGGT